LNLQPSLEDAVESVSAVSAAAGAVSAAAGAVAAAAGAVAAAALADASFFSGTDFECSICLLSTTVLQPLLHELLSLHVRDY